MSVQVARWLEAATLKRFPEHDAEAKKFMNTEEVNELPRKEARISKEWYTMLWNKNEEVSRNGRQWLQSGYDASGWSKMNLPSFRDETGGPGRINGVVRFRKEVEVPVAMAGKNIIMVRVISNTGRGRFV